MVSLKITERICPTRSGVLLRRGDYKSHNISTWSIMAWWIIALYLQMSVIPVYLVSGSLLVASSQ
jgi:hypothetical protein